MNLFQTDLKWTSLPAFTIALTLFVAGWMPSTAQAQGTTGTISGIVQDSSGAVVPGAEVVINHTDTGSTRTITSDSQGRYLAPNLAIGNYTVQAGSQGFQTEIRSGLALTIGQQAVINFTLNPGAVSEVVTIQESAPMVDTTSAAVGTLVNREQIRDLPLNGRDYTQLALLQPGVVQYREQSREVNRGMGTRFSVSGARHNQVSFRLNGLDISDGAGTSPGSATGHNLGLDAIQEFQVLTNTFGAEYGKSAGGILNVVHKAGTNTLHGSLFHYLRNSALDSPNYFDSDQKTDPFKRNQFGGSAGGPIVRDKLFFFGNYEGLRERLAVTGTNNVMTAAAKNGALGPVNPAIKPYLDLIPLPNIITPQDAALALLGRGTRETTTSTKSTEEYIVGKGDYNISESDNISGSYTFDDGQFGGPSPRDGIVISESLTDNRNQYVTLGQTHTFSPSMLNAFRFGMNRSHIVAYRYPLITVPQSLELVPGIPNFSFEVTGLDGMQFLMEPILDRQMLLDSYQFSNAVSINRGSHAIKFGMEFQRQKFSYGTSSRTFGGRYAFTSISNFIAAIPSQFQADDPDSEPLPYINQNLWGFFVQDDVHLTPRLTMNIGLRYEFIGLPTSTRENQSTLIRLEDPKLTTGTTFFQNPSLKNFAPRIGLAWDVFGNQRTAVRAGFGRYDDQLSTYYYLPLIQSNPPMALTRTLTPNAQTQLPFPNGYQSIRNGAPAAVALQLMDYNLKQPYRLQYNLGIQQQLPGNMGFAVYYVGAHAVHSTQFTLNANSRIPTKRASDGRLVFTNGSPVRNPNFATMQYRTTGGDSYYNAFQTVLNRRMSAGLQFQGSYTWSKSIDTGSIFSYSSEGLNTVAMQSLFDKNDGEKGLSAFDARHVFSMSSTYDLPRVESWGTVLKTVAGGWQVGGILNLATGHPFTPLLGFDNAFVSVRSRGDHLRPELIPGGDTNPTNPGNPTKYFDASQFVRPEPGTLGNLGRDTLIGPGLAQVDFTTKKRFHFSESRLIEFRAELFNLLDRANFRVPEEAERVIVSNAAGTRNATAGQIKGTTTTSRQIQFSLRYEF